MSASSLVLMPEVVEVRTPFAWTRGLETLTRADLLQQEAAVARLALDASVIEDAEPVLVRFRGRTIAAKPLDLRRFIRAMAPHVSMN